MHSCCHLYGELIGCQVCYVNLLHLCRQYCCWLSKHWSAPPRSTEQLVFYGSVTYLLAGGYTAQTNVCEIADSMLSSTQYCLRSNGHPNVGTRPQVPQSSTSQRSPQSDPATSILTRRSHSDKGTITVDVCLYEVNTLDPFPSKVATPRRVDIMLPPSYHSNPSKQYPVLYMHDGQNCINPETSFLGIDWGLDEVTHQLLQTGVITEFVTVLVWNTPQRLQEYMPAEALRWLMEKEQCWYERVAEKYYNPTSDSYLAMLVEELKPYVDKHYRTLNDRNNTVIMGSSMGGLISLYALQQYPEVFGAAACLSTHWVPGAGLPVAWLAAGHVPDPNTHRLYFDHGTEGQDAEYAPYQKQVDDICRAAGYTEGDNYMSRVYPSEPHDEAAWRKRLHIPLQFLFSVKPQQ